MSGSRPRSRPASALSNASSDHYPEVASRQSTRPPSPDLEAHVEQQAGAPPHVGSKPAPASTAHTKPPTPAGTAHSKPGTQPATPKAATPKPGTPNTQPPGASPQTPSARPQHVAIGSPARGDAESVVVHVRAGSEYNALLYLLRNVSRHFEMDEVLPDVPERTADHRYVIIHNAQGKEECVASCWSWL